MSAFRVSTVGSGGSKLTIFQPQPQSQQSKLCDSRDLRALIFSATTGFDRMGDKVVPVVTSITIPQDKMLTLNQLTRGFNSFLIQKDAPVPAPLGMFIRNLAGYRGCRPLIVNGYQVGLITPKVLEHLRGYPQIFIISDSEVKFADRLTTYESRTAAMAGVLLDMKDRNDFVTLKGWRNECFEVRISLDEPSILKMERAATCLFGIRQYGVDINGYINHPEKGLCIWLQKRSPTKQRWPGMWDNMVGGGLSVGHSVLDTAHKEAEEEASIPKSLLRNLDHVGAVSIFFESERGLSPNTEYVFDLELPLDFVPKNQDGEVSEFQLLTAKDALQMVMSTSFKTTSCPVALDFLIRYGILTEEIEPELDRIKQLIRIPLMEFYCKVPRQ